MEGHRAATATRTCRQILKTIYGARTLWKTTSRAPKNTSLNFAPPAARHGRAAAAHRGGLRPCSRGQLSAASPPFPRRSRDTSLLPTHPQLPRRGHRAPRAFPSSQPAPSRWAEGSAAAAGTYRRRAGRAVPAPRWAGVCRAGPAVGVCV